MSTLVIAEIGRGEPGQAEHDQATVKPSLAQLITASRQLPGPVSVLVAGWQCRGAAEQAARIDGVARVLLAEAEHYAEPVAEDLAALIVPLAADFTHVIAPATSFGKNLVPRLAALLDVAPITDVVAILAPDTFVRPIHAGNVMLTVQSTGPRIVATLRPSAFPAAGLGTEPGTGTAPVDAIAPVASLGLARVCKRQLTVSARPELAGARVVVSGGRGLASAENFRLLEQLADKLHAAIGASRAAVDAGFVPNDCQVGQTGKVVAPELYIAVGISGAIQHLAGMKDSRVIVAINKDPEAPIFQVADYGLVGDLFQVLPELLEKL